MLARWETAQQLKMQRDTEITHRFAAAEDETKQMLIVDANF